ncbi:MAG TPA: hypothetical protein VHC95_06940 [Opitutales bacterium]|nr:hypothetical protein [Opitutales bacterium]
MAEKNHPDDFTVILKTSFPNHRKVRALRRITGRDDSVLCLLRLWAYAEDNLRLEFDLTPDQLEDICEWEGQAGAFFRALEQCGWIDVDPDGRYWSVHAFAEHNGRMVANWTRNPNGRRGTQGEAKENPPGTQGEATLNPRRSGYIGDRGDLGKGLGGLGPQGGKKRFVPPTLQEWRAEAVLVGWNSPSDVNAAFHSFTSKGWKVGRSPMVNWKSAVCTCFERWRGEGGVAQKNSPPTAEPGTAAAFAHTAD